MENDNEELRKLNKRKIIYQVLIVFQVIIIIIYIVFFIWIFNQQNRNTTYHMTGFEIGVFNSEFTAYEGSKVIGSKVNELIQSVVNCNNIEKEERTQKKVFISYTASDGSEVSGDITSVTKKVKTDSYYTVRLEYDCEGLVERIIVKEND